MKDRREASGGNLWQLFTGMLSISAVTFGGGFVIVTLMKRKFVDEKHWITEQEMLANIRAWGYEDIMAMIWFCHRPIHGKPCGMCHPCQQKMQGMEFLLPEEAHKRYAVQRRVRSVLSEGAGDFLAKVIYKLTNS